MPQRHQDENAPRLPVATQNHRGRTSCRLVTFTAAGIHSINRITKYKAASALRSTTMT